MTPYPNIYGVIPSPATVTVLTGRGTVSERCTRGIPVVNPKYFHIQDWEDEWIEVAEHLVCDEYIDAYDNCAIVDDPLNDNNEVITLYL